MKREVAAVTHGSPVDSRAEEFREAEGPGDDQPTPDALITAGPEDVPPRSLPHDEIELRQDLGRHLTRIFPATREEILENAVSNHAPRRVIEELQRLPEGTYEGFPQVWEALGHPVEGDRQH